MKKVMVILLFWSSSLYAQSWQYAASMHYPRNSSQAMVLKNGKVLVAGGIDQNNALILPCEIYDPLSDTWTITGSLSQGRFGHQMVVLADGRVLAAGGLLDVGGTTTATCEIYDTTTGTWRMTTPMSVPREIFAMLLLPDSSVVIHAGLNANNATLLTQSQVFNPSTETFSSLPDMVVPHYAMNLFYSYAINGLVSRGGQIGGGPGPSLAEVDILRNGDTEWVMGQPSQMPHSTPDHMTIQLPDESILVPGGRDYSQNTTKVVELYDCGTQSWRELDTLKLAHDLAESVVTDGDTVLMIGGAGDPGNYQKVLDECAFIDPASGKNWDGPKLNTARFRHEALILRLPVQGDPCSHREEVLVVGGYTATNEVLSSCEKLDLGIRPNSTVISVTPSLLTLNAIPSCQNSTIPITIVVHGCYTLQLDSIVSEDSGLALAASISLPRNLKSDDTIILSITLLKAQSRSASAVKLVFSGQAGTEIKYVHIDHPAFSASAADLITNPAPITHGHLNQTVSYPMPVLFPYSINVDSLLRSTTSFQFELTFDTAELQVSSVTPPKGWSLKSESINRDTLSASFAKTSSSVHSLDTLGAIVFNVIDVQDRHTTLNLIGFSVKDSSGIVPFCITAAEGGVWVILLDSGLSRVSANTIVAKVSEVFPNPTNGNAQLDVQLVTPGKISVQVYDILGREEKSLGARMDGKAGHNIFNIPSNSLADGVYMVRTAFVGGVVTREMQVVR